MQRNHQHGEHHLDRRKGHHYQNQCNYQQNRHQTEVPFTKKQVGISDNSVELVKWMSMCNVRKCTFEIQHGQHNSRYPGHQDHHHD